jgi:hypothetical protein
MNTIQIDRMRKLITHLRSDKIGQDEFNIKVIHYEKKDIKFRFLIFPVLKTVTIGCAMGELPYLFPDECVFDGNNDVVYKGAKSSGIVENVMEFFGIDYYAVCYLFFCSNYYCSLRYGDERLSDTASRFVVADRLEIFLDRKVQEQEEELSKMFPKIKTVMVESVVEPMKAMLV